MPTLDWTCEQTNGVTLVELQVTGEPGQRVRVESRLDPVWPPRREGQPAAGWDGTTFEGELADGSLVVGYATPAEPTEPPADVQPVSSRAETLDPGDVVRALGAGTPPRDAVPTGPAGSETCQSDERPPAGQAADEPAPDEAPALPPAVRSYFAAVEQRLAAAAQLSEAETVEQAREAVAAAGGMDAVDGLAEQLQTDRARLDALGQRQQSLAEQLARTDVPVAHLDRLA